MRASLNMPAIGPSVPSLSQEPNKLRNGRISSEDRRWHVAQISSAVSPICQQGIERFLHSMEPALRRIQFCDTAMKICATPRAWGRADADGVRNLFGRQSPTVERSIRGVAKSSATASRSSAVCSRSSLRRSPFERGWTSSAAFHRTAGRSVCRRSGSSAKVVANSRAQKLRRRLSPNRLIGASQHGLLRPPGPSPSRCRGHVGGENIRGPRTDSSPGKKKPASRSFRRATPPGRPHPPCGGMPFLNQGSVAIQKHRRFFHTCKAGS